MSREFKHRVASLLMFIGFLSVVFGGLGTAMMASDAMYHLAFGIGGFVIFLLGSEIYLRTRKTL